jgi:hypothetical protein
MAWQPSLPGVFAFSFYGKRKGLAKRKTRMPRHPCYGRLLRIHAPAGFSPSMDYRMLRPLAASNPSWMTEVGVAMEGNTRRRAALCFLFN